LFLLSLLLLRLLCCRADQTTGRRGVKPVRLFPAMATEG
jgi:hypothetical protein